MADIRNDEFMLVRVSDKKVIIPRLFLSEQGISEVPCFANTHNAQLALSVNGWLESEKAGRVSFGKTKANP